VFGALCAYALWSAVVALLIWNPTGYVRHPILGRISRPGLYIHGVEGFSWSRINSIGLRGPEVAPKRAGEKRVLFLGDSFTQGIQVPLSRTFAARVGDRLGDDGVKATVVNAGYSGASPADYIGLSRWYQGTMAPDATVVQMSKQDFAGDIDNPERNFYVKRAGGEYVLVANTEFVSSDPLLRRFKWLTPLRDVALLSLAVQNVEKAVTARGAAPEPSEAQVATVADEPLIEWTIEELARSYPNLVILYLPHTNYLNGAPAPDPIAVAVQNAAADQDVEFVDVTQPLAEQFTGDHVAPTGFANSMPGVGHLNAAGHETVAAQLTPVIERILGR